MQRYTAVKQRRLPDYSAEGLPLGTFRLNPSLSAILAYDDNVFASKNNAKGDVFARIEPSVVLQSGGEGNYDLAFRGRGHFDRYANEKTENTESWEFGAAGKLQLGSSTCLRGGLIWRGDVESRQSSSVFVDTRKPVTYQTYGAGFGFTQDFSAIRAATELSLIRLRYDDAELLNGATLDQSYRDNRAYQIVERLSYAQSPSLAFFIQGRFAKRDYSHAAPTRPERDSDEYEVLAGTTFEAQFPVRGEIGVGYLIRKFENDFYNDINRLSYNVKLEVFPSELTTVTISAERRSTDTGDPQGGSSSVTEASIVVDHELLRTLILTARAEYLRDRAENIDRLDKAYRGAFSASYRLNPYLNFVGGYEHIKRTSRGLNGFRPFSANRLTVGLTLRR